MPRTVLDEGSLLVLISTHEPFVIFSLSCPAVDRSERAALVGAWSPGSISALQT